jgi:hypothetical protein
MGKDGKPRTEKRSFPNREQVKDGDGKLPAGAGLSP